MLDAETKSLRPAPLQAHDASALAQGHAGRARRPEQCLEHGVGVVGRREVLARRFELERHAQRLEPRPRLIGGEGAQHT